VYGERLIESGLKHGLGSLIDLRMYLQSNAHPGYPYDTALHAWTACATNISAFTRDAPSYYWYRVASCANDAHDANRTVEACAAEVPAEAIAPIRACLADPTRAAALVEAMHKIGDSYRDFPTIVIDGAVPSDVPEPDTHGDDVQPLIKKICKLASARGIAPLPDACA
jgi:hypothetical protein